MIHQMLEGLCHAVEAHCQTLTPVTVTPPCAEIAGRLQDQPVHMFTQRWLNPAFQSITLARIFGDQQQLLSVTFSAVPSAHSSLPILGFDYVGFRGMLSLIALDTYLFAPALETQAFADFITSQRQKATPLILRKFPHLSSDALSPQALVAAAKSPEQIHLAQQLALEELQFYFQQAQTLPLSREEDPTKTQQIMRWKSAMLQNKKEHRALAQIFGEEQASHYLQDFLFA